MLGDPDDKVSSVLIGLDPTLDLITEAQSYGADLIITHHPIIFRPIINLDMTRPDARFIAQAIKKKINIIACHTNFDSSPYGVSDILAQSLGLEELAVLSPIDDKENQPNCGLGRIGNYKEQISADRFVKKLKDVWKTPWLLCAGPKPENITKVAVCGGACSDLAVNALNKGADVFVTAEIKHSVARWAEQAGLWTIDAGHFATEQLAIPVLASMLTEKINANGLDVMIRSAIQESPLQMI